MKGLDPKYIWFTEEIRETFNDQFVDNKYGIKADDNVFIAAISPYSGILVHLEDDGAFPWCKLMPLTLSEESPPIIRKTVFFKDDPLFTIPRESIEK